MENLFEKMLERRYLRHGLFWLGWVIGFTFIKSFGSGMTVYAGWLFYYLITLPVFMIHTYLVVYWAAPRFLSGLKIILFVALFGLMMFFFSLCEMVITSNILAELFPAVFTEDLNYRDPLNVMISGIGNLYIILVFVAAKMIRSWHIADQRKRQIQNHLLQVERADANAGIQPEMLLFSIESIEKMGAERYKDVSSAIARLSALLHSVMQAHRQHSIRLDEELRNVRNLLNLYRILFLRAMPDVKIEQRVLPDSLFPAFMLFSPLEIVIRRYHWAPEDRVHVLITNRQSVEISWEEKTSGLEPLDIAGMKAELNRLYPERYRVCSAAAAAEGHRIVINENDSWMTESL